MGGRGEYARLVAGFSWRGRATWDGRTVQAAPRVEQYALQRSSGVDSLSVVFAGEQGSVQAQGSGVLEAFVPALAQTVGQEIVLVNYDEHSLGTDQAAEAVAYVQVSCRSKEGPPTRACGVGRCRDIIEASMRAVCNAVARTIPTHAYAVPPLTQIAC